MMIIDFYDIYSIFNFPPVRLCVLSLCTPNLDFERGGCWRTRVTHDRRTVFSDELMTDLGGSSNWESSFSDSGGSSRDIGE